MDDDDDNNNNNDEKDDHNYSTTTSTSRTPTMMMTTKTTTTTKMTTMANIYRLLGFCKDINDIGDNRYNEETLTMDIPDTPEIQKFGDK